MNALARLSLAVVLSAGLWVAYAYGQPFGTQAAKLTTVKVKDDLFVIHNDFVPGNTTVLITNEGVVLVDDKFEIDHDNIVAAVKKLTNQPIKYVINTHHHADHSGGNAKLQAMSVQAIASEQARENMVDGKLTGLPTMVFEHHAHVYLGGKNVELYHFGRAHTNGDVVVLLPGAADARGRRHVHVRRRDARAHRLRRRRQRQGVDLDARLGAAARFRQRRARPRRRDDEGRDAEVPRQHAAAAEPRPRSRRPEEDRATTSRRSCAPSSTGPICTSASASTARWWKCSKRDRAVSRSAAFRPADTADLKGLHYVVVSLYAKTTETLRARVPIECYRSIEGTRMNLSEIFIRRPIATSLVMLGIAVFGIVAYRALAGQRSSQRRLPNAQRQRRAAGQRSRHHGLRRGQPARAPVHHDRRPRRDDARPARPAARTSRCSSISSAASTAPPSTSRRPSRR